MAFRALTVEIYKLPEASMMRYCSLTDFKVRINFRGSLFRYETLRKWVCSQLTGITSNVITPRWSPASKSLLHPPSGLFWKLKSNKKWMKSNHTCFFHFLIHYGLKKMEKMKFFKGPKNVEKCSTVLYLGRVIIVHGGNGASCVIVDRRQLLLLLLLALWT